MTTGWNMRTKLALAKIGISRSPSDICRQPPIWRSGSWPGSLPLPGDNSKFLIMSNPSSLFLLFAVVLATACGPSAPADDTSAFTDEQEQAQEQSYSTMMAAHDRIMPRMGEINQLTRALETELSSSDLPDSSRQQIQAAIAELEKADDAMMEWMSGLEPKEELQTQYSHEEILQIYEGEATEIREVETTMSQAIDQAKLLLERYRNGNG